MRAAPALLGLLVLSGSRTVGAESCARAHLDGDPGAVAKVTDELHRLGITTDPASHCRTIDATVAIEGTGIAVAIAAQGRGSEGRVVGDARVAAVWIDSWLRDDFEAIEPAPPPPQAPEPIAAPRDVVAPAATGATLVERATVAASYEQHYVGDGSAWSGASATACLHFGALCVGGRVRGALQAPAEIGADAVRVSRSDVAALAVASVTIDLGRMRLAPELGLGIGRFATTRAPSCPTPGPQPGCDPSTDPTCPPPPPPKNGTCVGPDGSTAAVNETVSTIGPRAEAGLRIAIPLFDRVWLDGTAGISIAPLHRGASPAPMTDPVTGKLPALPGEPLTALQLGIGLRIGLP